MRVIIEKGQARGSVAAPPSKSMAHRLLICAAFAEGESVIHGVSDCDDVKATLDCLHAFGVPVKQEGDTITITGIDFRKISPVGELPCRESGSTLRFMIPICLLCEKNVMLTGKSSLLRRPMSIYENLSREKGFFYSQDEGSVVVKGPLPSGKYSIPGNISSQFISGLLFALPQNTGDSTITLLPPVESRSYIKLTIATLAEAGVKVEWKDEHTLFIPGSQKFHPFETTVEGDYSGAAFFSALNTLGGKIEIQGLREDSIQGDKIYSKYFDMLSKGTPTIHIGDCPDLGPILFAVAAAKYGGVFIGTSRLKLKESDRCETMAQELRKFGTSVTIHDDAVSVYPADFHAPSEPLFGHNDHRIVMSLSVLLTITGGEIYGAEAVSKSFPNFFCDLGRLGIAEKVYENN